MAEPSGEGDTGTNQILALGSALLNNFIYERIFRHQNSNAEVIRSQLGGDELCDPRHEKIAQCLQAIANELDGNEKLQEMIEEILELLLTPSDIPYILTRVAREIFSDWKFNWGRVVALFYFACRLVMKVITMKILEMIRIIINWIISYIKEHLINWIKEQGGWEGIRSCFGPPTWQTIGVFLAGVLTTLVVIRKMK